MKGPRAETVVPEEMLGFRRALYRGSGFDHDEIRRPLIGVAGAWGEINPAARHLGSVAAKVKEGVRDGGGTPVEFVLSGLCDGTCAGARGPSRYNLPWREAAASYLEAVAEANVFDGLVFVGVCDEVIPAQLLAAGRIDRPGLLVGGGSMEPGGSGEEQGIPGSAAIREGSWAGDMTRAYAALADGQLTQAEYETLEAVCCPAGGTCPVMGTANTMQVFAEACGMMLPGGAVAPGGSVEIEEIAYQSGGRAVELVEMDLRPSEIVTEASLRNGIAAVMAVGGSTCAVLHILALAAERGIDLSLSDLERIAREVPVVVDVRPTGRHWVPAYHAAGGVQATLAALGDRVDRSVLTVGASGEAGVAARSRNGATGDVIGSPENPKKQGPAMAVLYGSLAPDGAVIKAAGTGIDSFEGPARVFDAEEDASRAISQGQIRAGEVMVVRGAGPRSAPGMPCLYGSLWLLGYHGLDDQVALVTDGRLSGTIRGLAVGHVSPEAGAGSPLTLVRDGDPIRIDVTGRRLDLLVAEDELRGREAAAGPETYRPAPPGILAWYRELVTGADKGAVLRTSLPIKNGNREE